MKSYLRGYVNESIEIRVQVDEDDKDLIYELVVYELHGGSEKEHTHRFILTGEHSLRANFSLSNPGFHGFKVRFSRDGGSTFIDDPAPFGHVLIDPASTKNLRMYTLIPPISGTVDDWARRLSDISSMGFNAVHLLPLSHMDSSESPYAAYDLVNLDPSYLTLGQNSESAIQALITAATTNRLRLCFDLVLNHIGSGSLLARHHPDWIVPDLHREDGLKRAGYWHSHEWRSWDDLVLINYDHPLPRTRAKIWEYMTEYALYWAHLANTTGGLVRLDNLHSSNQEFIGHVTRIIRREYPEVSIVAEFFSDDETCQRRVSLWQLNLLLATTWDFPFAPQLRAFLSYVNSETTTHRYFTPITSHDSGSVVEEFAAARALYPRYTVLSLLGSGHTGIVQGAELGVLSKVNFLGRNGSLPKCEPGFDAREHLRAVNGLLEAHPEFHQRGNIEYVDGHHEAIVAAVRVTPTKRFLVVANFDIHRSHSLEVQEIPGFTLSRAARLLGDGAIEESGRGFRLHLPPCASYVGMCES